MNFTLFSPLKHYCRCLIRYSTLASKNVPCSSMQDSKESKVLHFFNKVGREELEQHNLAEKYIARLIQHREREGFFTSLSELVTITGLSLDKLQKVSKKTNGNNKKKIEGLNKLVTNPIVTPEMCKNIKNIVGLDITLPHLTLSHLSQDMTLHSWERIPISNDNAKYDIHACYNEAMDLVARIPKADVYLMEQKKIRPKHLMHVPYMIRQATLEAFILTHLNPTEILPNQLNVIIIKNSSLSNFYNIQVGNERVTGQGIIQKLLNGEKVPYLPSLPKMSVSPVLQDIYLHSNLTNKEFMCNSLLLCLAFYENIVFKLRNNV